MNMNATITLPDTPVSIARLADLCGVSRQRIYELVKMKRIHVVPMVGGSVVMPNEVRRVLRLRTPTTLKGGGTQMRFDFNQV